MLSSRASGFSLVEMLTVLVLASLVAALAWPSLDGMIARSRTSAVLNEFVVDVHYARMLAVKSGRTVVMRLEPGRCPPGEGRFRRVGAYRVVIKGDAEREARRATVGEGGPAICLETNGADSIAFNSRGLLHGVFNRTVHVRYRTARDSLTISSIGRVLRRF